MLEVIIVIITIVLIVDCCYYAFLRQMWVLALHAAGVHSSPSCCMSGRRRTLSAIGFSWCRHSCTGLKSEHIIDGRLTCYAVQTAWHALPPYQFYMLLPYSRLISSAIKAFLCSARVSPWNRYPNTCAEIMMLCLCVWSTHTLGSHVIANHVSKSTE